MSTMRERGESWFYIIGWCVFAAACIGLLTILTGNIFLGKELMQHHTEHTWSLTACAFWTGFGVTLAAAALDEDAREWLVLAGTTFVLWALGISFALSFLFGGSAEYAG